MKKRNDTSKKVLKSKRGPGRPPTDPLAEVIRLKKKLGTGKLLLEASKYADDKKAAEILVATALKAAS